MKSYIVEVTLTREADSIIRHIAHAASSVEAILWVLTVLQAHRIPAQPDAPVRIAARLASAVDDA